MGNNQKEPQDYFLEIDDDVMGIPFSDLLLLEEQYGYVFDGDFGEYIVKGYNQGFVTVVLKDDFETRGPADTHHEDSKNIVHSAELIYRSHVQLYKHFHNS